MFVCPQCSFSLLLSLSLLLSSGYLLLVVRPVLSFLIEVHRSTYVARHRSRSRLCICIGLYVLVALLPITITINVDM